MAQLMSLPLTVSCFSEIQIGFTFLVPAYPGSPGKRAVKRVCVLGLFCVLGICPDLLMVHILNLVHKGSAILAETVQITLLGRTSASSPLSECAGCRQQGHAGVKLCTSKILQLLTGGAG